MLIMLLDSFVCRPCVGLLAGQRSEWPSSAIVLAALSGRSAVGPPGPRVHQICPPAWKTSPPWNLCYRRGLTCGAYKRATHVNFVFAAPCYASAAYVVMRCLSDRLSVTFVHSVEIVQIRKHTNNFTLFQSTEAIAVGSCHWICQVAAPCNGQQGRFAVSRTICLSYYSFMIVHACTVCVWNLLNAHKYCELYLENTISAFAVN